MIQRVFVKVLDYTRLEHLPNCGECSQGNLSMPCTDFVSKIRSVSGGSASGHHSQKCIVGAIYRWADNYSIRPKVLSSSALISSLSGKPCSNSIC